MTDEKIKQLQDLLNERNNLQQEKGKYDMILSRKREDVGIEVFASGWHSADKVCIIHNPMPKNIWDAFKEARQVVICKLQEVEGKIAEF